MWKFKFFIVLFVFCNGLVFAQQSKLQVRLLHATSKTANIIQPSRSLGRNLLKQRYVTVALDSNQSFSKIFDFSDPQFVDLSYYDRILEKTVNYSFFISPGDDLSFTADLSSPASNYQVTGKGSNNNQPLLQQIGAIDVQPFYNDTVPDRIISALKKQQKSNEALLSQYVATYQPSAAFVKNMKYKLKYTTSNAYFAFKENNKFNIHASYMTTSKAWEKVQDSLFTTSTLNNDSALNVPSYLNLLKEWVSRKKENLWEQSEQDPAIFYRTWYQTGIEEGKKIFENDMENDLKQRIIKTHFKGKTAEYLYTVLLETAIEEKIVTNLLPIYDHYKTSYPQSEYVLLFNPYIETIAKRLSAKINDQMIFAANDGKDLQTFKELLVLVKGKTVLLDMWGTWCGPCRSEIEKHSKEIKAHFKGKEIDYVYVANFDEKNEKKWKELIPFFDLTGTHILANSALTKSIMETIKGNGYPTYLVIKKDGTFELSRAGYPMERSVLIKQLEEALALKSEK